MPSDLATASLASALFFAVATTLVAIVAHAIAAGWRRLRKTPFDGELMHRPGHVFARGAAQSQRRVQLALASLAAGIAGGASVALIAQPALTLAGWQRIGLVATAIIVFALIAISAALHAWRARRWRWHTGNRELVAQHLHRIGGERDRLFHDVITGDGSWVDHVLLGVQGAFGVVVVAAPPGKNGIAERHGDRLLLGDDGSYVDLAEARQRVSRLQHELSKQLGRMIRVRAVVTLPGWRIRNNNGDDVLVVGHSDIVMIKGWRNASDGLMNEDAETLQQRLEGITLTALRPDAKALAAHEPVIRPQREKGAGARDRKAAAPA